MPGTENQNNQHTTIDDRPQGELTEGELELLGLSLNTPTPTAPTPHQDEEAKKTVVIEEVKVKTSNERSPDDHQSPPEDDPLVPLTSNRIPRSLRLKLEDLHHELKTERAVPGVSRYSFWMLTKEAFTDLINKYADRFPDLRD